jgi:hypothetical protein
MVGSVVAFAVDPFWSCLRLDSDDVFAVELKEKVLDKPVLRPGGLLPLDNTPVQPSHNDKNAPTLSMCGGVWAIFVSDWTAARDPTTSSSQSKTSSCNRSALHAGASCHISFFEYL